MYEIFEKDSEAIVKCIIIAAVCIIISIVLSISSLVLKNSNQENELKNKLYILGATYYENVYYDTVEDKAELEEYSEGGMRVSLNTLINSIYYEDPGEFVNNKTDKKCSYTNSYVKIYPTNNYDKTDYEIEISLDCGF